jgi:hypothetical protein
VRGLDSKVIKEIVEIPDEGSRAKTSFKIEVRAGLAHSAKVGPDYFVKPTEVRNPRAEKRRRFCVTVLEHDVGRFLPWIGIVVVFVMQGRLPRSF